MRNGCHSLQGSTFYHVPLHIEEVNDNIEQVNDDPEDVDDVQDGGIPDQGEPSSEDHADNAQLRRSTRGIVPQRRYPTSEWILLTSEEEPESFREAQSHHDKSNWWEAMGDEMKSLQKNQTYDLQKNFATNLHHKCLKE
ncbi:unnamed protein product [Cuscuta epithymum]|uniref:Uncharacterized protein n=1 Tax=Cuscuta epithymum TaxID=186058 RepID=A0AAV0CQ92_9ASTE|nr:unnamed protein product [Cuscuta epithymum]